MAVGVIAFVGIDEGGMDVVVAVRARMTVVV